MFVVSCLLFVVLCSLFVVCRDLFVEFCGLYFLSIACCVMFVVC